MPLLLVFVRGGMLRVLRSNGEVVSFSLSFSLFDFASFLVVLLRNGADFARETRLFSWSVVVGDPLDVPFAAGASGTSSARSIASTSSNGSFVAAVESISDPLLSLPPTVAFASSASVDTLAGCGAGRALAVGLVNLACFLGILAAPAFAVCFVKSPLAVGGMLNVVGTAQEWSLKYSTQALAGEAPGA